MPPVRAVMSVALTIPLMLGVLAVGAASAKTDEGVQAGTGATTEASRRAEVLAILQSPPARGADAGAHRGAAIRALGFDALPIASDLLGDPRVGGDAANAMLHADAPRALALIFASMPTSGLDIQRIGFTWFLDGYGFGPTSVDRDARAAALRVLERPLSTAMAVLAVYVLGVAGSEADVQVLEGMLRNPFTQTMRGAGEAALARLGAPGYLEQIRAELARPLPANATYRQGVRLVQVLQQAAFSGRPELVPAVCGHVGDPVLVEIDISVNPGASAARALSAIVDRVNLATRDDPRRSRDDWRAYCTQVATP